MIGVETLFRPWRRGCKLERRLGRLLATCCMRDICGSMAEDAKHATSRMLSWLLSNHWYLTEWDGSNAEEAVDMGERSILGQHYNWLRQMTVRHPAEDSHVFVSAARCCEAGDLFCSNVAGLAARKQLRSILALNFGV